LDLSFAAERVHQTRVLRRMRLEISPIQLNSVLYQAKSSSANLLLEISRAKFRTLRFVCPKQHDISYLRSQIRFIELSVGEMDITVKTKSGSLEGVRATSSDDKKFTSFVGIPYASPPKRFSPAQPVKPWVNVRKATEYGPVCRQRDIITR
jgi:hypothetical protein